MRGRSKTAGALAGWPGVAVAAALCVLPAASLGATLLVGPGKPYQTVRAAAQAARDGDSVLVDAGVYSGDVTAWNANNVVVRGVGGRAHMRADGAQEGGKGTWVIYGSNFTAENIEFSGSTVPDQNGAGIRKDSPGYLIVRNCYFHDNDDGILGGADSMLIENSIFDHNGYGDGRSHNMYVWGRTFTIRNCYTHRAVIGHNIKTRADNNYILYNRIMDEADGSGSYDIDIPDGGRSYIIGNVIEQGPNTDNPAIIAYAAESSSNGVLDLYVINNTIVNNRSNGGTFLTLRGGTTARVTNNIFYGPGTNWSGGTVNASNNYFQSSYNNSPGFANPATFDFHLTSTSPGAIVDAGVAPGVSAVGYDLTPSGQYVYDAQVMPRPVVGALDLGAFEYGQGAGDSTPPATIGDLR